MIVVEYQIIKRKDDFCNNKEQFKSLLKTNSNYKISDNIIEYKSLNIKYSLENYSIGENQEIMFVIKLSIDNETDLDIFEKFDKSFLDFMSKFNDNFSLNVLWDDISKEYALKIYPKIFYIESTLRKIIYFFMSKNVGKDWIKKCFPKDVENSINTVKSKNHSENDENILYYADFIQLSYLLFLKYPTEVVSQNDLIQKLKIKDCNTNELINKYEFKSNWDRYFEPIINKCDLEDDLNNFYNYRNLVAHNRKIRNNEKKKFDKLTRKIELVLDKCLEKIDNINVPESEKESVENIGLKIFNPLKYQTGNKFTTAMDIANIGATPLFNLEINPEITAISKAMNSIINENNAIFSSLADININPAIKAIQNPISKNLQSNIPEDL